MNLQQMSVEEMEIAILDMQAEIEARKAKVEIGFALEVNEISGGRKEFRIMKDGVEYDSRKSKVAYSHIAVRSIKHVDFGNYVEVSYHKSEAAALKPINSKYASEVSSVILAI